MPTMSQARCCALYFPDESWINNLGSLDDPRTRDALYVEQICWNISGAVAECLFGESDFFGELGLRDLEGVHEHRKAYDSLNRVPEGHLLAACTGVVEQLFAHHYELMEDFSGDLLKQGELEQKKLRHFLRAIKRRKLGNAVLEALKDSAIDDEADRVHRMYFGS